MGFLSRFKSKETEKAEKPQTAPVKLDGKVSMLWDNPVRRQASQDELAELQRTLKPTAEDTILEYNKVLALAPKDIGFSELDMKEAGMLAIVSSLKVTKDSLPKEIAGTDLKKGEAEKILSILIDKGLVEFGNMETRINDAKYSVLLDRLGENSITVSTSDKVERVKEIIDKARPILPDLLSDIPERYSITDDGKALLEENPILGQYFSGDDYGITVTEAVSLTEYTGKDLYESCRTMYMELMKAWWAKGSYKEYYDYSVKLTYLCLNRSPRESAYALAHVINANSLYKSGKILWEAPLAMVYSRTDLSIEDIVRYCTEQYDYGIYPKRTKVDKFEEVFRKYLAKYKKTLKAQ